VHPEVASPADWTRELTAEAVSVVCQWHGGDWCSIDPVHVKSRGQILAPSTRAGRISILRYILSRSPGVGFDPATIRSDAKHDYAQEPARTHWPQPTCDC
jgi:hypothetical protein